jgi:hypothetical protein
MVDPTTLGNQEMKKIAIALQNILGPSKLQAEQTEIERLKLPVICGLADELVEERKSVAMLLNFT